MSHEVLSAALQAGSKTFASNAICLRRAGFAVVPLNGKSPLVRGFNKWKAAPGENQVGQWTGKYPDAAIGYVPGLCANPLVVLDGDDAEACGRIEETFGSTPAQVQTRRGRHFIFAARGADLKAVTSLKVVGINADVKYGRSIVVAPPSPHAVDPGIRYAWVDCDPTVIRDLPPFNTDALRRLLEGMPPTRPPTGLPANAYRNGSRGLGLNDYLVAHSWAFEDFDGGLDVARTWNEQLQDHGIAPLDDAEVIKRVEVVMRDLRAGKIDRWHRRGAACISDGDEIRYLTARYSNGADAFTLLLLLRAEHQARCLRGETFVIVPKAMAEAHVIGEWGHQRYRNARETLLEAGRIREVAPATARAPAKYTLVAREPTSTRAR